MRRGTRIFFAASLVAQAAALVRYVILARMLGPAELGLAATLLLTAQFFESVSDTGANRFIVQDARGDAPQMQGLVQMTLAVRGALIAVALALTSGFVAGLYQAPVLAPALVVLGASPFIMGFQNLDVRRAQRVGDFRPEAAMTIVGEVVSAVCTGVAAWLVQDHTAVIYGLVARAAVMVLVSHIMAERRYRWAFGMSDARQFSLFAAPLFLNGLLLFFGSQGDRIVVATSLGAEGLGHYSAILLLVYYPAAAISRFIMGIHMPQVARARDDPGHFARERDRLGARCVLLAVAMLLGFSFVGPPFAPLLYGQAFAQPLPLFAALAVLQGARLLRFWPTTIALGTGDSLTVLMNNIVRMAALPLAFAAYAVWPSIYAIVAAFVVGEFLALLAALLLLVRRGAMELGAELKRSAVFAAIAGVTVLCSAAVEARSWFPALGFGLGTAALALYLAHMERATIAQAWRLARKRILRKG